MGKKKKSAARKKERPEKFSDIYLHHHRPAKHQGEKPEDIRTDQDFHHEQPFNDTKE